MVDFVLPKSVSSSTFVVNWKPPKGMVDFYKYTVKRTTGEIFLKNTTTRTSFTVTNASFGVQYNISVSALFQGLVGEEITQVITIGKLFYCRILCAMIS